MKIIKFTDSVHERIMKDKEHFTETIGYRFTLSDTVREYQKILDGLVEKKPPLQNSPRLPLETPEDKQTCDFSETK